MVKHSGIILGIICLMIVIGILFLRITSLDNLQKAFAMLPQSTIQAPEGKVEKVSLSDYSEGNKNANVTVIEYSDFECPSCQRMHPIFQNLIKEFGNNIRFVQRMFPLPQNKNAEKEAEAALCAGEIGGEGAYWKYGDTIFRQTTGQEGGEGFPLKGLVPLAKKLDISEKSFRQCLDSGMMLDEVNREKKGGEEAGINELPTVFITDKYNNTIKLTGEQTIATLRVVLTYITKE